MKWWCIVPASLHLEAQRKLLSSFKAIQSIHFEMFELNFLAEFDGSAKSRLTQKCFVTPLLDVKTHGNDQGKNTVNTLLADHPPASPATNKFVHVCIIKKAFD